MKFKGHNMTYVKEGTFTTKEMSMLETLQELEDVVHIAKTICLGELGGKDKILQKLIALTKDMPGKIETRQSGSNTPLCLHISAIEEFCQLSELKMVGSIQPKSKDWLTADELRKYFVGQSEKILAKLRELAEKMPDKIQQRKSGGATPLCLHISGIEEFRLLSGLERRTEIQPKTKDWLNATELAKYFIGGRDKILKKT